MKDLLAIFSHSTWPGIWSLFSISLFKKKQKQKNTFFLFIFTQFSSLPSLREGFFFFLFFSLYNSLSFCCSFLPVYRWVCVSLSLSQSACLSSHLSVPLTGQRPRPLTSSWVLVPVPEGSPAQACPADGAPADLLYRLYLPSAAA